MAHFIFGDNNKEWVDEYHALIRDVKDYKKVPVSVHTVRWTTEESKRILFVGRAPNGNSMTVTADEIERQGGNELEALFHKSTTEYYTHNLVWSRENAEGHSAFWKVVRGVVQMRYPERKEEWDKLFAWTNLYKIAPREKGTYSANPDRKLREMQIEHCKILLKMEVEELKPEIVVLMVGQSWIGGFLRKLNDGAENHSVCCIGEKGDLMKGYVIKGRIVVVTERPEGKKIDKFVEMIGIVIGKCNCWS